VSRVSDGELRLREALERIKRECGVVCASYETCGHASCRSSHRAWEVAASALNADRMSQARRLLDELGAPSDDVIDSLVENA
jgi:hypothetical protein